MTFGGGVGFQLNVTMTLFWKRRRPLRLQGLKTQLSVSRLACFLLTSVPSRFLYFGLRTSAFSIRQNHCLCAVLCSYQCTLEIIPQRTLANTKLPPKTYKANKCERLSTTFVTPPLLDSNTDHYSSTTAHRASLFFQRKATERSENVTSSRSTITDYHTYQK